MQATAEPKYPGYYRVRDEQVEWFAEPIVLGQRTDVAGGYRVVAVGVTDKLEERTVNALIVGVEGHLDLLMTLGQAEVRLGWRIKLAPGLDAQLKALKIARS
jgi:hypothetical protein